MIWRDHNFEYGPYCWKNIFQGISRDDAFRNFVLSEYEGHIWNYDLSTLCFVLCPQFLDNLETFSKEIYLVSWIFEKYVCIPNWSFFCDILKIWHLSRAEQDKVRHRGIGDESRARALWANQLERNSEPERARVCQRVAVRASESQSGSHREP